MYLNVISEDRANTVAFKGISDPSLKHNIYR